MSPSVRVCGQGGALCPVIQLQEREFSVPFPLRSAFPRSCIKFAFPRACVPKMLGTRERGNAKLGTRAHFWYSTIGKVSFLGVPVSVGGTILNFCFVLLKLDLFVHHTTHKEIQSTYTDQSEPSMCCTITTPWIIPPLIRTHKHRIPGSGFPLSRLVKCVLCKRTLNPLTGGLRHIQSFQVTSTLYTLHIA